MKNQWIYDGDTFHILLKRGDGTIVTRIDECDFITVDDFPGTWVAKWNPTAQTFYARNNSSYGWKGGYMHRLIMGVTDPKVQVDHKNHQGIDNLRRNLVVTTRRLNGFNRRGAERGSISGRRNVYWNARERKYMVWFVHNGVRHYFGYFDDAEKADVVAQRERARFA